MATTCQNNDKNKCSSSSYSLWYFTSLDITEFKIHKLMVQKTMNKAPTNVCKTSV